MSRRGDYYYDDEEEAASVKTDLSGVIEDKVQTDLRRGTVIVFGKEISVGREAAKYVDGLISQAETFVTQYGGSYARKYGIDLAKALKTQDHYAARVGQGAEFLWRFGLPIADVAMGVKSAVGNGYSRMHALSNEAAAVLAANNDMKVGMGKVLTTRFRALANERALIFREGRKTMLSSLTGVIKKLPGIIINVWKQKAEMIEDPDRVYAMLPPNASAEERERADQKYQQLLAMQTPAPQETDPSKKADPIGGAISRLLRPKSLDDINENLKLATVAPFLGGLLGGFVEGDMEDKNRRMTAWRAIKRLENMIKEQEPESADEITQSVRGIFQQHVQDCGVNQKLAGNKFNHLVDEVSEALVTGNLHPQALVELLDNEKVFAFGEKGVAYGKIATLKEELAKLSDKYTAKVTQKEFYKDAPFTKEDVSDAFKNLTEEEKPFFVMLFPPGMLENAGIDKAEVAQYREEGQQCFIGDLTHAVKNMMEAGRQSLQERGVNKDVIDEIEAIEEDFTNAMHRGRGREYVEKNFADTVDIVRNAAFSAKDKEGFWQEYVHRNHRDSKEGRPATAGRIPESRRRPTDYVRDDDSPEERSTDR